MSHLYEHASARRILAARLQERLANLPRPDRQPIAEWSNVLRQRRETEVSLAEELTRWPGCRLVRSPSGTYVCLLLDGLSVFSRAGVVGACRAWLAAADELGAKAQGSLQVRRRRRS